MPALKLKIDTLEDVEENLQGFYSEVADPKDKTKKIFVLQVEGAQKTAADVERLEASLVKERADHKKIRTEFTELKAKAGLWGDLDPTDTHDKLTKLAALELEPNATQEKIEQAVKQRVEAQLKQVTAPLERELAKVKGEHTVAINQIGEYDTRERNRRIDEEVRRVAQDAKVTGTAIDDAVIIGRNYFQVDPETNKVVNKETGLDPLNWIEEQKEKRTHWWAPSRGAGAEGGGGPGDTTMNPFSAKNWNMTEQGKLVRANPGKAAAMAKAAGTSVGGARPPAPKGA